MQDFRNFAVIFIHENLVCVFPFTGCDLEIGGKRIEIRKDSLKQLWYYNWNSYNIIEKVIKILSAKMSANLSELALINNNSWNKHSLSDKMNTTWIEWRSDTVDNKIINPNLPSMQDHTFCKIRNESVCDVEFHGALLKPLVNFLIPIESIFLNWKKI